MGHRFFTLSAGLILTTAALFALSGCSDDKSTNSGNAGNTGLTEDQTAMQQEVNAASDSLFTFLSDALESRTSIASGGTVDPIYYTPIDTDSDVVVSVYDTTSGWHQVYVSRLATAYSSWWQDSIQFRNLEGEHQRTGPTATNMSYRHVFNRSTIDTTTDYYNRVGSWSFDISGFQTPQATINGTIEISTQVKYQNISDSTVWRTYTYSATTTDLTINKTSGGWNSACPVSGTITATMTTTYKMGSGDMVTRNWDVTIEFYDGTAAISVTNGSKTWETNYNVCTPIS